MHIAVPAGCITHLDVSVAFFSKAIHVTIAIQQLLASFWKILVHKSVENVRTVRTEDLGNEIRLGPAFRAQIFENAVDVLFAINSVNRDSLLEQMAQVLVRKVKAEFTGRRSKRE